MKSLWFGPDESLGVRVMYAMHCGNATMLLGPKGPILPLALSLVSPLLWSPQA